MGSYIRRIGISKRHGALLMYTCTWWSLHRLSVCRLRLSKANARTLAEWSRWQFTCNPPAFYYLLGFVACWCVQMAPDAQGPVMAAPPVALPSAAPTSPLMTTPVKSTPAQKARSLADHNK